MRFADHPAAAWVLAAMAFALAAIGARSQPGGFNDASRLATAEVLIEHGTFAIDQSVFLTLPPELANRIPHPNDPDLPYTILGRCPNGQKGTLDRLYIDGQFYSDKPMLPAVFMAAAYRVLMPFGLPSPSDRPDIFGQVCTILTCGIGYAVAVAFMWMLGIRAGLSPRWRLIWLAGFALATVLPAYTRNINSGVPQLAAVAGLCLCLIRIAEATPGRMPWGSLIAGGTCLGFSYVFEQATGALLVLTTTAAVALRTRSWLAVAVFLLASAPWAIAHHAIHYAIGGVWVPLNMVPEYLEWPGSDFDRTNMTGIARHPPWEVAVYAMELLIGPWGFLIFNLPLFLAVGFGWLVLVRPGRLRIELMSLMIWCVAVWLVYSVLSDNYGGFCLTIRWFVPLLVPGFWLLAKLLVEHPTFRWDFLALSACGLVTSVWAWPCGPWLSAPLPPADVIAWVAMGTWAVVRVCAWRMDRQRQAPKS